MATSDQESKRDRDILRVLTVMLQNIGELQKSILDLWSIYNERVNDKENEK